MKPRPIKEEFIEEEFVRFRTLLVVTGGLFLCAKSTSDCASAVNVPRLLRSPTTPVAQPRSATFES